MNIRQMKNFFPYPLTNQWANFFGVWQKTFLMSSLLIADFFEETEK
ncbi:MAG: hypothetical protein ACI4G1_05320 [Ruminococcus sp.]